MKSFLYISITQVIVLTVLFMVKPEMKARVEQCAEIVRDAR